MMRLPTSAFENRTHGAEKIGPSRYSDFFNTIGQYATCGYNNPQLYRRAIGGLAGSANAYSLSEACRL
jgi:hypothetical protein